MTMTSHFGRVRIGGRTYIERKVAIRWTDKTGRPQVTRRWLSQVETYVRSRRKHGDPGPFFWRLHDRAIWHEVKEVT